MVPPAKSLKRILPSERMLRLSSGIVLFSFATTHFFNAGMGLFGVEAANAAREIIGGFWKSYPGTVLLYLSMTIHIALGFRNIAMRRNWRMPVLEAVQIGFGFLIPFWLMKHIIATRGIGTALGTGPDYKAMYIIMWPDLAQSQSLLLLLVWVHGCIGLYMVMRLKPWFPRAREILLSLAVSFPLFALAGFLAGMREAARRFPEGTEISAAQVEAFTRLLGVGEIVLYSAIGLVTTTLLYRLVRSRVGPRIIVRYADGPKLRTVPGATLLEISRANSVPHASVCGGRARCSTCRVRILEGETVQPEPNQAERRLLARINAPESVRLACQLRPVGDIAVQRLVDAGEAARRDNHQIDPFRWGVERRVTLLFADIRGFTTIAEQNFAFDIVFVLNRFLSAMSSSVEANGGRVDKYLGDGLMAIFGVNGAADGGARGALDAAKAMGEALASLNTEFLPLLNAELRIGIGLHTGPAILGRIGGGANASALTALGDTVNIAARLEEMTKALKAVCVVSEATMTGAGIDCTGFALHDVAVRGRSEPLRVRAFLTFEEITSASDDEMLGKTPAGISP